jgi:hypothetical protein
MSSSSLLLLLLPLQISVKDSNRINIKRKKIGYMRIPLAIIPSSPFTFYISKSLSTAGALIGVEFRSICWLLSIVLGCLGTFLQGDLLLRFSLVGFKT